MRHSKGMLRTLIVVGIGAMLLVGCAAGDPGEEDSQPSREVDRASTRSDEGDPCAAESRGVGTSPSIGLQGVGTSPSSLESADTNEPSEPKKICPAFFSNQTGE